MKIKYIWLLLLFIGLVACDDDNDSVVIPEVTVQLTAGSADFSTYVALGNSLTAGITDGALFAANQENSFPNILSQKFAMLGGGVFTQPLMNDNTGGLLLGGTQIAPNRLVTTGGAPVSLESVIGPVMPTTDLLVNNPTGPFNNMGVPSAKVGHLLAPGYGNISGLFTSPATANPFFVRMALDQASSSVLGDAMFQQPTFFSLWIGANDVLGYALTGGDGTNPISPVSGPPGFGFQESYGAIIATLTSGGAGGVVANIPDVTTVPHFTTVTHNVIPLDAATAGAVNGAYAAYNGGLQLALGGGLITQEEADARTIMFVEANDNAVVIEDESLTNLSGLGLPNYRQATANDLFVLPASSFIGTEAVPGNPFTVNGVAIPLADKWVLVPSEQAEIAEATTAFNTIIKSAADAAGIAHVDANAVMQQIANGGLASDNYILTADLVTGGVFSLDGFHPTARGSALISNEFLRAIDATYGSNFEAAGMLSNVGDYPTNYSPLLQ